MDGARPVPVVVWFACVALVVSTHAADWSRFRGPNGSGVSPENDAAPVTWSTSSNIVWKKEMPGPGSSSPIIVGDRVYLTYWSGYGVDSEKPGEQQDLKRHVLCLDRKTGETVWDRGVQAVLPEDDYRGMFAQHGYATHTPVSDGERIYVFFGKTGVLAFDLDGKQLWQTSVGDELDGRNWGSASSPILHGDKVIVLASAESHSIAALDKATGAIAWQQEAEGLGSVWTTPNLITTDAGDTELILAVPGEVWGMNPDTGKLNWYCNAVSANAMCASAVVDDGQVYLIGGREGGSIAIRSGGKGDVSESHIAWQGRDRAGIGTPVLFDGRLYWVNSGVVNCIDAKTGERVYQSRLQASQGDNAADESPTEDEDSGGRPRRGGMGNGDYASPVVANGKLYHTTRGGETYVILLGPEFKQLAVNSLASDGGDFSATPAVSKGQLFVRSSKFVYCIGAKP
ncbi:MAG: PQQ-like beta-propeller repeat protein [Planctomycetales bacterium]|nr:PQQ-like beta-propeller repeat protein [Planctomycetales bacterium]